MLAALHISAPVLIALIGGSVTLATALGGIAGFHAYKSAASGWREERNAAVAKAERLERDVQELRAQVAALQAEVRGLRAKDVSSLHDLMVEHHQQMVAGAQALQERDAELLDKVKQIAAAVQPPRRPRKAA